MRGSGHCECIGHNAFEIIPGLSGGEGGRRTRFQGCCTSGSPRSSRIGNHIHQIALLASAALREMCLHRCRYSGTEMSEDKPSMVLFTHSSSFTSNYLKVLRNCDELFEHDELSAAPDVSWPDCFNSGVFVFRPSERTFSDLLRSAVQEGSFDGGDQGLLNQYFSNWLRLPFAYNVTANATYCYLPAFNRFRQDIRILHFAGRLKPWLLPYNSKTRSPCIPPEYIHATEYLQLWWKIFFEKVHQHLNVEMVSDFIFSFIQESKPVSLCIPEMCSPWFVLGLDSN